MDRTAKPPVSFKSAESNERSCPLCGSRKNRRRFSKKGYHYHQCAECGHVFVFPLPSEVEEAAHYEASYSPDYIEQNRPWFQALAARRMDVVESCRDRADRGTLLDAGCGYGLFLDEARRRGWETLGIDSAAGPLDFARKELGLLVRDVELLSGMRDIPDASLAVITFWHVLEHLAEPGETLRTAVRKLAPGGLLVVNSPNLKSAIFSLVRRHWSWIYTPGHVQYFSLDSLRSYLQGIGLTIALEETWTDAPNLFYLLEEAFLLWLSDLMLPLAPHSWRFREYERRLRGYVYTADHQVLVQFKLKAYYDRFPRLDRFLRARNLGHEFVLLAVKR